jgi:hypothetical protein
MSTTETEITQSFFDSLFEHDQGFLCIATTRPPARRDTFHEEWFKWPDQREAVVDYVEKVRDTHNVYFCVNIMSVPRRKKDNAVPQNIVWADLDACRPDQVDVPPQVVIESSPYRYQAIWRLDRKIDPFIAESYAKRIAYRHADLGVDKSGHDITQLLRVPGTYNWKYATEDAPAVKLIVNSSTEISTEIFDRIPDADNVVDLPDVGVPVLESLPSVESVVYRYTQAFQDLGVAHTFSRYYSQEPPSDWSGHLWRLLLICFEVGMTAEEVFVIAKHAKCNKYERDGRPDSHLWREILKAELERKTVEILLQDHRYLAMPSLLSLKEESTLQETIIDEYVGWATEATDAVPEFHEITCAMVLSAMMATNLRLPLSLDKPLVPNLWALVIGESTTTRKTTAMDMGMRFIDDIAHDMIVASHASMEGLMSTLALRPRMVSIFYRDEVTGFFSEIRKKDYLADMDVTMTKLYDVPSNLTRVLKKDKYTVSEPIFIFFGGGVPDKMYSLIDENDFASGFIPRFLVMRGYGDTSRLRPVGPPVLQRTEKREALRSTFSAYHEMYTQAEMVTKTHDGQMMALPPDINVSFTDEMWARCAQTELSLMQAAEESPESSKALPMFSRMYFSLLKLTCLLAASRQEPDDHWQIRAEMRDLISASYYIQRWGRHAVDLVRNSGVSADESKLMAVYHTVEKHPGIMRSNVMQRHRLDKRAADLIEDTLAQRLMIQIQKRGTTKAYWPIGR